MKTLYPAIAVVFPATCLSSPAAAQTTVPPLQDEEEEASVPSELAIGGGVALVSDYRFRGISLSDEDFAVQGHIDIGHSSGFYVGAWASSIEDSAVFGHTELDLYAGYSSELAEGVGVDVGLLYYVYPNGQDAFGSSDYFEPYASLSYSIGPVETQVGVAYAWDQSAIGGDDNVYVFADAGLSIPNTAFSVSGHVGRSDGSLAPTGDYWDWSLGADYTTGPLTFGIAYVDTDLGDLANVDAGIVLSVGAAF